MESNHAIVLDYAHTIQCAIGDLCFAALKQNNMLRLKGTPYTYGYVSLPLCKCAF